MKTINVEREVKKEVDRPMKDIELYERIKQMHKEADTGIAFDAMDVGITLSKMSPEQLDDLYAMITWMENNNDPKGYILGNVYHDLRGLKAVFLNLSEGEGFVPRSYGYAKKAKGKTNEESDENRNGIQPVVAE